VAVAPAGLRQPALVLVALLAGACHDALAGPSGAASKARLPEGASGIAAKYPGDRGIEKDQAVLFVEKFDAPSPQAIFKRWDSVKAKPIMSLSPDVPAGSGDRRSLLMTHVGGGGTGGYLYRRLLPGHALVFARFYVKFDAGCAPIHHFGTHLGGFNPPTPWPQGGAGQRPRGDRRFTTGVEPFGKRWSWDFYTYWQGMHVHGDGRYWGTPFLTGGAKPKVEKGRWICVEMMVKANDPPGEANGEQAFWIDGKLFRRDGQVASHIGKGFPRGRWTGGWWRPEAAAKGAFEGFRWRSVKELAVNYVWAYLYITKAPRGHVSKVWFDNIVIATRYVGPMAAAKPMNAFVSLNLEEALPNERGLQVHVETRGGKIAAAIAKAPSFSKAPYNVDASKLALSAGLVKGDITVTLASDGHTPPVGKTVRAVYAIGARVHDGCVTGRFTGTFGDEKVSGAVVGRLAGRPLPPGLVGGQARRGRRAARRPSRASCSPSRACCRGPS